MWNLFWSTFNKCTITIMTSGKNSLEIHFLCDFKCQFLKINVLLWKKVVLHATILMHWKGRQVLRDLFITNQGNDSHMTFLTGATKINFKNLKTWRQQLYSDEWFELLTYSGRSLTWAYNLKALKSSSYISATNWLKIFLIHVIT